MFDTVRGYLFRYHKAGDDRVRPSAGSDNADLHAENSRAVVSTVYGNTVKWNQLLNENTVFSKTGGTLVINDGVGTFTASASAQQVYKTYNLQDGHIYVAFAMFKGTSETTSVRVRAFGLEKGAITNVWQRIGIYYSAASNIQISVGVVDYRSSGWDAIQVKNYMLFDLTDMFGSGYEPSTVDGFENWLALNVGAQDYYAYDHGSLISFGGTAIKSTSFNQWDEMWEHGIINLNTGKNEGSATSACRSINYIKAFPSTTYYFKKPANASNIRIFYYDSNKSLISYIYTTVSQTFTTPSNGCYIRFNFWSGSAINYNHDICINLSDTTKNGTYEPYDGSPERTCDLSFVPNIGFASFNIWDEQWEVGSIDNTTGQPTEHSSKIRTKNFIQVFPETTYRFTNLSQNGTWNIYFYDANKEFISPIVEQGNNFTFVTPVGCRYIKFRESGGNYGITYNHDICINESVAALNGTYMPYGTPYYLFPDGKLKSAGTVSDEVSATTATKRIGSVDMGTLDWTKGVGPRLASDTLTDIKYNGDVNLPNAVCAKYPSVKPSTDFSTANNVFTILSTSSMQGSAVLVADSDYTDAATFKAAMSGVILYYELATPIEISLSHPMTYKVDKYSTEELLVPSSQTGAPTSTALNADIDYQYRG